MKVTVFPSVIQGRAIVPASKSIAQRMAACALLAKGVSVISHYPDSDDCLHALEVIKDLGAIVVRERDNVTITGGFPNNFQNNIRNPKSSIHCGESGLAARMFAFISALWHEEIQVEGQGTLMKRSMSTLDEWLPLLGAKIKLKDQNLPARIQGPLYGGEIETEEVSSSQFITGALIAGAKTRRGITLELKRIPSLPYVYTTAEVANKFGVQMNISEHVCSVKGGQSFQAIRARVDGDWSGAAVLFVLAALTAENGLIIEGLSTAVSQADQAILEVLQLAGVRVTAEHELYTVYASTIQSFEFDATHCPDLFPVLAALAVFANGVSVIKGVSRLADKESHRGKAIQHEWAKMGVRVVLRDNEMKIYPSSISPSHVHAHHDHRMAMALSVFGVAGAPVTIHTSESVNKSFPGYFEVLKSLNVRVE